MREQKKHKFQKECGYCGEFFYISDMTEDEGATTGWICDDCLRKLHPEYEDFGEY